MSRTRQWVSIPKRVFNFSRTLQIRLQTFWASLIANRAARTCGFFCPVEQHHGRHTAVLNRRMPHQQTLLFLSWHWVIYTIKLLQLCSFLCVFHFSALYEWFSPRQPLTASTKMPKVRLFSFQLLASNRLVLLYISVVFIVFSRWVCRHRCPTCCGVSWRVCGVVESEERTVDSQFLRVLTESVQLHSVFVYMSTRFDITKLSNVFGMASYSLADPSPSAKSRASVGPVLGNFQWCSTSTSEWSWQAC